MTQYQILALAELAILVLYSRSLFGGFLFDDHAISDMDFNRRGYYLDGSLDWTDPRNHTIPPVPVYKIAGARFDTEFSIKSMNWYQFKRTFWRAFCSFCSEPRAFTHLTYLWCWKAGHRRLVPWIFHAINIWIHQLNTLLVFMLVLQIRPSIAGYAALLFAVHPHQVAAVSYISGRAGLLVTFFALAGTLAGTFLFLPVVILCALFAHRSKEDGYAWLIFLGISFAVLRSYFGSI